MVFKLTSEFKPQGDQIKAIEYLVKGIKSGEKNQVLLGATGTGKTFVMANIIAEVKKPTLILAPNKTLVLQIYQEIRNIFPNNKVEYYVSYFDYYLPESLTKSLEYISKKSQINKNIQKNRLRALNSLVTDKEVIVVASVAAIYGCFNPNAYRNSVLELYKGQEIKIKDIVAWLVKLGYSADYLELNEGCYFVESNLINLKLVWDEDYYWQLELKDNSLFEIRKCSVHEKGKKEILNKILIAPAREYTHLEEESRGIEEILKKIRQELQEQVEKFKKEGKLEEAQRLESRTNEDLIDLGERGQCPMIENYSRYFDGRKPGEKPYVLLDYFPKDFLTIIDESHLTIPQIRAMYNTDQSRKNALVKHGFRLPSALDNRPLTFSEFIDELKFVIYSSATPGPYELKQTNNKVVEQIIRPTGILDPIIEVRSTTDQTNNIVEVIKKQIKNKEKTIVYCLTIKMSEDITNYLNSLNIRAIYLHNKMDIFARNQAINSLRRGIYNVIVGINLLREGLDLPEVSLICILDADKPGFLRDTRSLIQIIGRVARHQKGKAILYGDKINDNMKKAIEETKRRRDIQHVYNQLNKISPKTVKKEILNIFLSPQMLISAKKAQMIENKDVEKKIRSLKKIIKKAVKEYDFDRAIEARDLIFDLQQKKLN